MAFLQQRRFFSYAKTLGDVYSGTLIKPNCPQLQLPVLNMEEDYHFTWTT